MTNKTVTEHRAFIAALGGKIEGYRAHYGPQAGNLLWDLDQQVLRALEQAAATTPAPPTLSPANRWWQLTLYSLAAFVLFVPLGAAVLVSFVGKGAAKLGLAIAHPMQAWGKRLGL